MKKCTYSSHPDIQTQKYVLRKGNYDTEKKSNENLHDDGCVVVNPEIWNDELMRYNAFYTLLAYGISLRQVTCCSLAVSQKVY